MDANSVDSASRPTKQIGVGEPMKQLFRWLRSWRLVQIQTLDYCEFCDHCADVAVQLCTHTPACEFVIDCVIKDDPLLPELAFTQLTGKSYNYTREKIQNESNGSDRTAR